VSVRKSSTARRRGESARVELPARARPRVGGEAAQQRQRFRAAPDERAHRVVSVVTQVLTPSAQRFGSSSESAGSSLARIDAIRSWTIPRYPQVTHDSTAATRRRGPV